MELGIASSQKTENEGTGVEKWSETIWFEHEEIINQLNFAKDISPAEVEKTQSWEIRFEDINKMW